MPFGIWSLLPGRAQCKWTFSFQVSKVLLPAQGSLFNISQHRGRRLLRVPWTTRRSNQFILKEISPEYSLEGLMWNWNTNTLATWCKELTHWKRPWCWKRLKVQGERADRGWDGWMASPTRWTWVWSPGVGDGQGGLACCDSWGHKELDTTEWLNWKTWKYNTDLKNDLEWVKSLSCVRLFGTPWTVAAYHTPLSMGFSRQEYWSGLPFPSPEDLPDPGIEPRSSAL